MSIGHRPGLELFHTRALTLKKVYRKVSAASRAHPRDPGFWSSLRDNIAPKPWKKKKR